MKITLNSILNKYNLLIEAKMMKLCLLLSIAICKSYSLRLAQLQAKQKIDSPCAKYLWQMVNSKVV